MSENPYDVVVVGSGIAGLSAAVAAAEEGARVLVVDRAAESEAGGNTRWTAAYFRLDDVYEPDPTFVDDLVGFSDGRTPRWYVDELLERLPETMEWIQGHGARFRRFPTYFINSARPRLQPHGGGEALLAALRPAAQKLVSSSATPPPPRALSWRGSRSPGCGSPGPRDRRPSRRVRW
jgi:tricarballylate dehydrogenase